MTVTSLMGVIMSKPTFSIIVPVYNTELYLRSCLDSIAAQTYTDFEVIMIDDGSEDGGAAICKEYSGRDNRFSYYVQENGGVSSARNAGIGKARGEWLLFVDSDDELPLDALQIYKEMCSEENVSLCMGTYVCESYEPKDCYKESRKFKKTLGREQIMELMFLTYEHNYQGYVWNKVFRRDMIEEHHLRFDCAVCFNEDRLFCVEYICMMKGKALFTSVPVYRYYRRQSGVMGGLSVDYNPNLITDFDSSVTILRRLQDNGFPLSVLRLGKDRIIDSYDIIRHSMTAKRYEFAAEKIAALRERTVGLVGLRYYIGYRIRRFLSKQYYNVFRRRIYVR